MKWNVYSVSRLLTFFLRFVVIIFQFSNNDEETFTTSSSVEENLTFVTISLKNILKRIFHSKNLK